MAISQAEFARRRNVSRARVTQWVQQGKIFGAALVDGGIDEAIACEQLRVKLDIDQRLSGNGLATNLEAAAPAAPVTIDSSVERQIAQERLIGLQRQNREKATEEAVRLGELVEASAARQATGRIVARIVQRLDGSLPEIAAALATEFKLPQRDVLHLLKREWRKVRQAASIEERERAEPMPATVGYELADGA